MSEELFFAKLRDILVYLYPEEADARRVVNDAGMDGGNISFSTKAINNWTIILLQAQKENKTANLMAVTFRDYKENEKLSRGWHDYLVTVRNREVSLLPNAISNPNAHWHWGWVGLAAVIFISIGMLLQWSSFALNKLVFPNAAPASNSSVFQPTAITAISPTEREPTAVFTAAPKVTETSLPLGDVSVSPTLTYSTPTITQTLTRNISITPTVAQRNIPMTPIGTTISFNEPTKTPAPISSVANLITPISAKTPIKSSTKLGTLFVKVRDECTNNFSIDVGDQQVGRGKSGTDTLVATGTYEVTLSGIVGKTSLKRNITIQEGKRTVVDFSHDLGLLLLTVYPNYLQESIGYDISQNGDRLSSAITGQLQCVIPGIYTIQFGATWFKSEMVFNVEVKAEQKTIVGPETWPKQLGLLSFSRSESLAVRIIDLSTGVEIIWMQTYGQNIWLFSGRYKIIVTDPYAGLTYDIVEINKGEETVLQLPSSP